MKWVRMMPFDILYLSLTAIWSAALADAAPSELRTSTNPDSASPSVQVLSSTVFPFVTTSTQTGQSFYDLEELLVLQTSAVNFGKAIHDIAHESAGKLGLSNPPSVAKSDSEVIRNDSDVILSFGLFLKAVINSIGRYLIHHNVLSSESFKVLSDSYLSVAVSALESSAGAKSIVEALPDAGGEYLSLQGIIDAKHVPLFASHFQDELRPLADNKNVYEIASAGGSGIKQIFDLPNSEFPKFASLFKKCPFGIEPYLFLEGLLLCSSLKFPTSSPKQKRSVPRQSFYTLLSNFIESSNPLSKGLERAISPESKKNFDSTYRDIRSLLDFEEEDEELATSLYSAIRSTLEHRSPEILVEAVANSMEKLLASTHRLTPNTYDEVSESFLTVLKEGEEVLDPEEDEYSHVKALGISIYRFLIKQKLTSTENLRSLVSTLVSELHSLSETSTPLPEKEPKESKTSTANIIHVIESDS